MREEAVYDLGNPGRKEKVSLCRASLNRLNNVNGWGQLHANYLWNFGYKEEAILAIIRSLPPRLDVALRRLLDCLQTIALESTARLKLYSDSSCLSCKPLTDQMNSGMDCLIWHKANFGIINIEFDPRTQCRSRVIINPYAAHLWGFRKGQMLEHFMHYTLPLPFSELDALRIFVVDLCRSFQDVTTQYVRFTLRNGDGASGLLVCITKCKVFDPFGRLTQVCQTSGLECIVTRMCA